MKLPKSITPERIWSLSIVRKFWKISVFSPLSLLLNFMMPYFCILIYPLFRNTLLLDGKAFPDMLWSVPLLLWNVKAFPWSPTFSITLTTTFSLHTIAVLIFLQSWQRPSYWTFDLFLKNFDNSILSAIMKSHVTFLARKGIINASFIGLDSTPVAANTSQNNPKAFLSNKFNPDNQPKSEPHWW